MESLNMNSPDTSSEDESSSESSGDEGSPGTSVKRVQETPQSRREAQANEFAETISDQKVIDTLNRTKMASKVKKQKLRRECHTLRLGYLKTWILGNAEQKCCCWTLARWST